ncbi:hypothetical protein AAH978_10980 [Streptomyces sp. ZYX-F-203]
MSATSIALLLTTAATGAVGVAVLRGVLVLRRQVAALHADLLAHRVDVAAARHVPAARTTPEAEEIRAAITEALAEERERELAEARAFWAARETRDGDTRLLLGLAEAEAGPCGPADLDGLESVAEPAWESDEPTGAVGDSADLAAARRRHPSHPDFVPHRVSGAEDPQTTGAVLTELAADRVELADVRPGPLGTLDVYVFADGTTLCLTPGHRETAERLSAALREGDRPTLLGGSGVSGAYALTFACRTEHVYLLADRVVASR